MRIVIDLQGAQSSGSRNRGIGRYTMSLAQAIVRNKGVHEVILALNGLFPDTIEPIRGAFASFLPQENIRIWESAGPVSANNPSHKENRQIAEIAREAFLSSLQPDVVLNTSLFEGLEDDAITSIGNFTSQLTTAVILYDLIPLIHSGIYLQNPVVEHWYLNKIDQLRRADLLLSISASSGQEAIDYLGFPASNVVNISTACDSHFKPQKVGEAERTLLSKNYGLTRPFVMYTGGNDWRKNVEGLIKAYANLPRRMRAEHQLVIVCSTFPALVVKWRQLADEAGLATDELVMTGFVPDKDLVLFYNACKLFVFPSWHEGFGLPALEAMACGRAVIGANTSSVPEVIGCPDALFDPFESEDIGGKIQQVLGDDEIRIKLERHSLIQACNFSWETSARRAVKALEDLVSERKPREPAKINIENKPRRPRLAYFSPLPPEQSGISDYSAELLPELARHYEIEVIVAQNKVLNGWIQANVPVRDIEWFRQHAYSFDRVMYHFGNSEFHGHMFKLLEEFPGVVVLHDFFLSGIVAYLDGKGINPHGWARALVHAHGWTALQSRYQAKDPSEVVYAYPCNLEVLERALGVIVHSKCSNRLAENWFGPDVASDWSVIPLLRTPAVNPDRHAARQKLGLAEKSFVVCSFGHLGPTKLNQRLLLAWLASPMSEDSRCHLVFVGQNNCGDYGVDLARAIDDGTSAGRIEITGWTDERDYKTWLAAADVGVQLRTLSRGETSAAVLDCMNYGLATVVNANGSMADLSQDSVWMLPDEFSDDQLVEALTSLWRDDEFRATLGQKARNIIRTHHQPRRCAEQYAQAIEYYYQKASVGLPALFDAIAKINPPLSVENTTHVAAALANNFMPRPRRRQLLLDVSELVLRDSKTGIQRVVRSYLIELLLNPPTGYAVEPVYASADAPGYRYARRFTSKFLDVWEGWAEDELVDVLQGDVFLGLEWQPAVAVPAQKDQLLGWQRRGVKVLFVVYDLLPVLLPQVFPDASEGMHQRWLETISYFDGALCISRAVADELNEWLQVFGPKRERPFNLAWFHLGADVENSVPTTGIPSEASNLLNTLGSSHSFLMVGTIEPRKGYLQTLAAFTELWRQGLEINLVIVGQEGWKTLPDTMRRTIPEIVKQIHNHPELGKRLFWLEGISDAYLEKIYAVCSCLIAASEGEGFGLPLIEGAQHGLPIIARDIPVFHEVAGKHAFYFSGCQPLELANSILEWIALDEAGKSPQSDTMPWLTWKQSTQHLLDAVLADQWYRNWMPGNVQYFWGGDSRLGTQVGKRNVRQMISTGQAGYLLFGPYISLEAGQYRVTIRGALGENGLAGAYMDVAVDGGNTILGRSVLSLPDDKGDFAMILISLNEPCTNLEVRIWVSEDTDLQVSMIEFAPWQGENLCRFWASDNHFRNQVGKRSGNDVLCTGQAGYLLFGPYISLVAGQYQVTIRGALHENDLAGAHMDVVADRGGITFGQSVLSMPDENGDFAVLLISLDEPCTDLEVRVWVSDDTDLQVSMIEIAPWQGENVCRFWASDNHFKTQVGKRSGNDILCTGQAGYLLFGPYISLAAGQYQVTIRGALDENDLAGAHMDVVADKGDITLGKSVLSMPDENGDFAVLLISLDEPCTDLEIRVWVSEDTNLSISMIEIAPWKGE